ncbi:MAG: PH domain-containing protein [Muribaculaceae bacterium]|nr:PH domain-containing protein [Muribaculaceae bacterium]
MKFTVKLSLYSILSSAMILIVLLVLLYNSRNGWEICLVAGAIMTLLLCALIYMPLSISVSGNELSVNRSFKVKTIRLSEIRTIELCQPTLAERRICGSNGIFGYWGWFREKDLGKYFAYYGKSSDCFLVRLKDGRQYMLGCENPQAIVSYIKELL